MLLKIKPLVLSLFVVTALGLASCGSQTKSSAAPEDTSAPESDLQINGDSDSNKAGGLRTVNFDFDSAVLTSTAKSILDSNASFLKANNTVEVQVEGHCDERGGVQYNLALGENRAKSVKNYLVSMGIAAKRISTISFGKERPISFGHDESSWSQNRRANFVLTAK